MKTPVCVSFRGAAGDEEFRTALKMLSARFLALSPKGERAELSHRL
jgi:hypothetical protein